LGAGSVFTIYKGTQFLHLYALKPTSRLTWRCIIEFGLKPFGLTAAAFCFNHSLQDDPAPMVLEKNHFISEKIRNSDEYKNMVRQLASENPTGSFNNVTKTIEFSGTDLFLAFHCATIQFSGSIDPGGNPLIQSAVMTDRYDFDYNGYFSKKKGYAAYANGGYGYGYGYGSYAEGDYGYSGYGYSGYGYSGYGYGGYGYGGGLVGLVATIANNMAWSDQYFGVVVPYDITVNIE